MVAEAAWGCADPGVQYDTTINRWHTCPNTGRINASNPCSEYMFLDDTACNLASLNLTKFLDATTARSTSTATATPSASSSWRRRSSSIFSSYPTKNIAQNSHDYRPLGLGYANLGTLLMLLGVPYDSDEGARDRGGAHRDHVRPRLPGVERRDGGDEGPVRRLREEPRADAARDAHAPRRGLRDRPRRVPRDAVARRLRRLGRRRARSASSTATATRRRRCSRRPAPSAS